MYLINNNIKYFLFLNKDNTPDKKKAENSNNTKKQKTPLNEKEKAEKIKKTLENKNNFCNSICIKRELNDLKDAKNCYFQGAVKNCYSCQAKPSKGTQIEKETEEKNFICERLCNQIENQEDCKFYGYVNLEKKQIDSSLLKKHGYKQKNKRLQF